MTKPIQCFYVNLSDMPMPAAGEMPKPFDGMAAGVFTDMWGSTVEFKAEDLPTYVTNTRTALGSTKDTSGKVVGFPIDGIDHRGGYAAGWITDVSLAPGRPIVMFTPRWNTEAVSNISQDRVHYFSPTIDIEAKTIVGGSLTNWPATRDDNNNILLRPIELGSNILTAQPAQGNFIESVKRIVKDIFGLAELGAVPYKDTGKADEGQAWSKPGLGDLSDKSFPDLDDTEKRRIMGHFAWTANNPPQSFGDLKLPHHQASKTSIGPAVWNGVAAAMGALMGARGGADVGSDKQAVYNHLSRHYADFKKEPPKFGSLGEMDAELYLEGVNKMEIDLNDPKVKAYLDEESIKRAKKLMTAELVAKKRQDDITAFVAQLSTGDGKKALAIDAAKLTAFLTGQADPAPAMELLKDFAKLAMIDFTEKGHGRTMQGTQPLPDNLKPILVSWLKAKRTLAEFFQVNAVELGAMEDYDLTEFEEKEK